LANERGIVEKQSQDILQAYKNKKPTKKLNQITNSELLKPVTKRLEKVAMPLTKTELE